MKQLSGIKYTKDRKGNTRYVRIDLDLYGNNPLLEDFLDGLEAEARKNEPTVTLEEFNRSIEGTPKNCFFGVRLQFLNPHLQLVNSGLKILSALKNRVFRSSLDNKLNKDV